MLLFLLDLVKKVYYAIHGILHAFNKGWNLLYENKTEEILDVLYKTSFIWISHEHPDHFSIKFFQEYQKLIKEKNKNFISIYKDKRVINF